MAFVLPEPRQPPAPDHWRHPPGQVGPLAANPQALAGLPPALVDAAVHQLERVSDTGPPESLPQRPGPDPTPYLDPQALVAAVTSMIALSLARPLASLTQPTQGELLAFIAQLKLIVATEQGKNGGLKTRRSSANGPRP